VTRRTRTSAPTAVFAQSTRRGRGCSQTAT
jgi:hypothetical protein